MTSLDTFLSDLLSESPGYKPPATNIANPVRRTLTIIRARCQNCGHEFEYPSALKPKVWYDQGGNREVTIINGPAPESLPREFETVQGFDPVGCQFCWKEEER